MTCFDNRDLPLSTRDDTASLHYNEGVTLMLAAWPGAAECIDAAIAADPEFALAHAARGRLHAIFAQPTQAKDALATAAQIASLSGDARERSHVDVLVSALGGASASVISLAMAHLDRWPNDAIIFSLLLGPFGLLAFSGMTDHNQARVDLCARHEQAYSSDDWWFLTYAGWSVAENGEASRGRRLLERAIGLRRSNGNGIHALAHAMFEQGASEEADRLLLDWLPAYGREGILHGHLVWHRALNALERGDVEAALTLYAAEVQPKSSLGMPINVISDGASFLWRLSAYGHTPPPAMWDHLSEYTDSRFPNAGHAFIDAHMMMIAAATGGREKLNSRLSQLDARIAESQPGAGRVVPAIGRGLAAFAEGEFALCASLLEPVAHEIARIGGSGAQREVFEDTLLVAYMRSGAVEKARRLLDERLHRRPSARDTRWRDGLAIGGYLA